MLIWDSRNAKNSQTSKITQRSKRRCEMITEASIYPEGVCSSWSWTLWSQSEQEFQTKRISPKMENLIGISPSIKCKDKLGKKS